jgi:hypothetical protein
LRRKFELFTGNLLMGTYTFITLTLPEGWVVQRSASPPDIYYMGEVGGRRWILEGYAHYYLANHVTGESYDLLVEVKKGRGRKEERFEGRERRVSLAGHRAFVTVRSYARGLFRKEAVTEHEIRTYCDVTNRRISIQISSPSELPEEVLEALLDSECH